MHKNNLQVKKKPRYRYMQRGLRNTDDYFQHSHAKYVNNQT